MENKIVVTMTSWTKRINQVARAIYRYLTTQTIKPDVFYLWLAEEEFPNKEDDLPEDLLLICEGFNVKIKWTKYNEYCFKRWRVYPEHYNDFVISMDDDIIYDSDLIETCINRYKEIKEPCVISWQKPGCVLQPDRPNIIYDWCPISSYKTVSITNYFLGQTCFTPRSFPVEIFTDKYWNKIREICPKCDESVIHPFLIKNGIKIYFCSDKEKAKTIESLQDVGLLQEMHNTVIKINGKFYKKQHILKYNILKTFPELQEKWKIAFPNYNFNEF